MASVYFFPVQTIVILVYYYTDFSFLGYNLQDNTAAGKLLNNKNFASLKKCSNTDQ